MKMSMEERVKILEDKVQKLEGGNPFIGVPFSPKKEEPMGKEQKVSRPLRPL